MFIKRLKIIFFSLKKQQKNKYLVIFLNFLKAGVVLGKNFFGQT